MKEIATTFVFENPYLKPETQANIMENNQQEEPHIYPDDVVYIQVSDKVNTFLKIVRSKKDPKGKLVYVEGAKNATLFSYEFALPILEENKYRRLKAVKTGHKVELKNNQ